MLPIDGKETLNLLERATKQVICGERRGTGFFVSERHIITCRHVISEHIDGTKIELQRFADGNPIEVKCVAFCEKTDLAVLELPNGHLSRDFVRLVRASPVELVAWRSFGYPLTSDGQKVGERLTGTIGRYLNDSSETIHDVALNTDGFSSDNKYEGFSGSAVINLHGNVVSIIRYENHNYLSAVTILKANAFLLANGIDIYDDEFEDFEHFQNDAFSFAPLQSIKQLCEERALTAVGQLSPNKIFQLLGGKLFFPEIKQSPTEIMSLLRVKHDMNIQLWQGWLTLLTLLSFTQAKFSDPGNILLSIQNIVPKKIFGIVLTSTILKIDVKIKFHFTEEKDLATIVHKYIADRIERRSQVENLCCVLNSPIGQSWFKGLHRKDIDGMVFNIAGPESSGPSVANKIDLGIMTLNELRYNVAASQNKQQITENLEKLFKDAIT